MKDFYTISTDTNLFFMLISENACFFTPDVFQSLKFDSQSEAFGFINDINRLSRYINDSTEKEFSCKDLTVFLVKPKFELIQCAQ